jgi:type IV secretory pathway VirB4 component
MTALKRLDRAALSSREAEAGSRLPYAHHVDDHMIALRDGSLMTVLKLDGFPFETADDAELNYRQSVRTTLLRSLGSSRFGLYSHIVRRKVAPYPDGTFSEPFSRALNEAWRRRVTSANLYVNDLYLTIIRRRARSARSRVCYGSFGTGRTMRRRKRNSSATGANSTQLSIVRLASSNPMARRGWASTTGPAAPVPNPPSFCRAFTTVSCVP